MAKPPTVHDVARLSGVSTATVSRYFTGKTAAIAPATLESVRTAAETLGYTPSEIGRSLRLARSGVVVMLVPDATNMFTADVAASVEAALKDHRLSMVLANTAEDGAKQDRLLDDALGLRARAIVLQGAIDTPRLRAMAARHDHLVFVNRQPSAGIAAPYVGIDNFEAGRAVGRYFRERGYDDCVAIHGPRRLSGSGERLEGFIAGLEGRTPRLLESEFTMEAGYAHGQALLAEPGARQAVFCGNDMIAYGLHRAARERGLRVPEDLIVFGFDDNRVNAWLAPWLSTVRVPAAEFGPAIAGIIAAPPQGRRAASVILPFALALRSSA